MEKIASAAHTEEIGAVIVNVMKAIETGNKDLDGILLKDYANRYLDKRGLGDVVNMFTNMDMSGTEDKTKTCSAELTRIASHNSLNTKAKRAANS